MNETCGSGSPPAEVANGIKATNLTAISGKNRLGELLARLQGPEEKDAVEPKSELGMSLRDMVTQTTNTLDKCLSTLNDIEGLI